MGIFNFFKKKEKKTKWDIDYEKVNTPEKAREFYTEAIERDPKNENLYVERGKAYESLKQYDLAIQDFSTALRLKPEESYFYYFLRHRQYIYLGDMKKALEDIKESVKLSPNMYRYEPFLAELLEEMGQRDNAISVLNQGIGKFPESVKAYLSRAKFYEEIGYLEEALSDITQAINMESNKAIRFLYLHQRAKTFVKLEQFDNALRDCNECITTDPKEWTHYRVRSEVYDAMGNHWAAKADYETSMNLNPSINR